mmetsp:Transcript_76125/g.219915  ORF Transcript_76125/g.219915 Transcript_76125/m.219915 type:complete len:216 (+) Transcript_76125:184-831(+)
MHRQDDAGRRFSPFSSSAAAPWIRHRHRRRSLTPPRAPRRRRAPSPPRRRRPGRCRGSATRPRTTLRPLSCASPPSHLGGWRPRAPLWPPGRPSPRDRRPTALSPGRPSHMKLGPGNCPSFAAPRRTRFCPPLSGPRRSRPAFRPPPARPPPPNVAASPLPSACAQLGALRSAPASRLSLPPPGVFPLVLAVPPPPPASSPRLPSPSRPGCPNGW